MLLEFPVGILSIPMSICRVNSVSDFSHTLCVKIIHLPQRQITTAYTGVISLSNAALMSLIDSSTDALTRSSELEMVVVPVLVLDELLSSEKLMLMTKLKAD